MQHRPRQLPPTAPVRTDGLLADHSWVRVYPHRLTELARTGVLSPAALELLLHLMTRIKPNSATVSPWISATTAAELGRHPDTVSAATTELRTSHVLTKDSLHGTTSLRLDPTLVYRGDSSEHRDTLRASHIAPPPNRWVKVFTPSLRQLIADDLAGSRIRVLLRLIALIDTGSTTPALGSPRAAAAYIDMSRAAWSGALHSLEQAGYIHRTAASNTGPVTVHPAYAFRGSSDARKDARTAWNRPVRDAGRRA
ncbi:hypothetical protein [Cellulomonas sp. Y8]|uniref:hypothetical protein n=1 Tax=Cellulomonas sp. Y8 TaxID=2591145 RepID=UPI0011CB80D4|nr:hypothetical protein [Cellulomonas sp. Y8]